MGEGSTSRISRHQFLKIVAGSAIGVTLPRIACAQSPGPTTHVYKIVGQCQIKADVHRAAPGDRKPAVMWIHGGALIMGSRKGLDSRFHAELVKRGFAVVSIDYRPTKWRDTIRTWNQSGSTRIVRFATSRPSIRPPC